MKFYSSSLLYVIYALSYYFPVAIIARKTQKGTFTINIEDELSPALSFMEFKLKEGLMTRLPQKKREYVAVMTKASIYKNMTDKATRSHEINEYLDLVKKHLLVDDEASTTEEIDIDISKIDESIGIEIRSSPEDLIFISNLRNGDKMYPEDLFADEFYWTYVSSDVFPNTEKALKIIGVPINEIHEKLKQSNIKKAISDGQSMVHDEMLQMYYKKARTGDMAALKSVTTHIAKGLQKVHGDKIVIEDNSVEEEIPLYILEGMTTSIPIDK